MVLSEANSGRVNNRNTRIKIYELPEAVDDGLTVEDIIKALTGKEDVKR